MPYIILILSIFFILTLFLLFSAVAKIEKQILELQKIYNLNRELIIKLSNNHIKIGEALEVYTEAQANSSTDMIKLAKLLSKQITVLPNITKNNN